MARIGAGMKCISLLIIVANVIFLLLGILLLVTGALTLTVFRDFEHFLEAHHFSPAALLISVGVFILFVSFFGCCGALKHSTVMINIHATLLGLILIVEIGTAITAFAIRSTLYDTINENMIQLMNEFNTEEYAKDSWDFLQQEVHCCGIHKPLDWSAIHIRDGYTISMDGQTFKIPYSCCDDPKHCKNNMVFGDGCLDELNAGISHYASTIGYATCVLAAIQMLGIIFSCMLAKAIRRTKTLDELERQRISNMRYATTIRTNAPTGSTSA